MNEEEQKIFKIKEGTRAMEVANDRILFLNMRIYQDKKEVKELEKRNKKLFKEVLKEI